MERTALNNLLENSASVNTRQTEELEQVVREFPYFQAARAIYLKGLYSQESPAYNRELKKTAACTQDRSVLFDYITSAEFIQDKVALQIKKQEEQLRNITVFEPQEVFGNRSIAIDEAIRMNKTDSDRVMDPALFQPRPAESLPREEQEPESPQIDRPGSPLEFNPSESHSFSEWLQLTQAKPVNRNPEKAEPQEDEKSRKFELIDQFISKAPKIQPGKTSGNTNLAQEAVVPEEALMTETLARVYLEQKNYKKAVQAYKILILKNPEKSGFFADQIRAIKKLQDNNTGQE